MAWNRELSQSIGSGVRLPSSPTTKGIFLSLHFLVSKMGHINYIYRIHVTKNKKICTKYLHSA